VVHHGRGDPGCSCCRGRSVMRNTRCFRAKASDRRSHIGGCLSPLRQTSAKGFPVHSAR
jgi:hypothetical protein